MELINRRLVWRSFLIFVAVLVTTINFLYAEPIDDFKRYTAQIKQYRNVKHAKSSDLNAELIAKERFNVLKELIHQYPQKVFLLLSKENWASMPDDLLPYLETKVENISGKLEILAAIYTDKKTEAIEYHLIDKNGKRYRLYFYPTIPKNLRTGQEITIKNAFLLPQEQGKFSVLLVDSKTMVIGKIVELPDAFGDQHAVIFALNFSDKPQEKPFTLDEIKKTSIEDVSKVYDEYSFHQASVSGDVFGWFTLPYLSTDSCDSVVNNLPGYIEELARNNNIDLSKYQRRIYLFVNKSNCDWAGLGNVGGVPSNMWLNGLNIDWVTAHELGHNVGLWHSKSIACIAPNQCNVKEYGDAGDVMGSGGTGHFNAFQKERLGYLAARKSPPIQTITSSGKYTLTPFEIDDGTPKALKFLKQTNADGSSDFYYIELRQPIGADIPMSQRPDSDYVKGILIHTGNNMDDNSSFIIDMTPGDNNSWFAALLPGNTYRDPNAANGGIAITLNSLLNGIANVTVTFGSAPPPPPPPPPPGKCNAPINIKYSVSIDKKSVALTWSPPNSGGVLKYEVDRPEGHVLWVSQNASQTSYTDTSLPGTPGTFVYYLLSQCTNGGKSKAVKRTVIVK